MNDHSTRIFNYVRQEVTKRYPKCTVTSSAINSKDSQLPALLVKFRFPGEDESTRDSSGVELWTRTVVDAQSFSGTSVFEARNILVAADEALARCGFRRSNWTEVSDADPSVRRLAATWRAKLDKSGNVAPW